MEVDGELLIDGATVNVVPLGRALQMGATRVFILQLKDLDTTVGHPRRPVDVLHRAFAISRNFRFLHELAAVPAGVEVHVLPTVSWARLRYDGFSRTPELIDRSHAAAAAYLDAKGFARSER